jgi:hypothetical protein
VAAFLKVLGLQFHECNESCLLVIVHPFLAPAVCAGNKQDDAILRPEEPSPVGGIDQVKELSQGHLVLRHMFVSRSMSNSLLCMNF